MNFKISTKFTFVSIAITAVILLIISYSTYKAANNLLHNQSIKNLSFKLKLGKKKLIKNFKTQFENLNLISTSVELNSFLSFNGVSINKKKDLEDYFFKILTKNNQISQIRLIKKGNFGNEIVRVERFTNGKLSVTETNKLQKKGEYNYVKKALGVSKGNVFISKINLNREHGKIEIPINPVVRFATPVFLNSKEPFGIVVINVSFNKLMADISANNMYITFNDKQQFLLYPDRKKSFSFEFGNNHVLGNEFNIIKSYEDTNILIKTKDEKLNVKLLCSKYFFDPLNVDRYLTLGISFFDGHILKASNQLLYESYTYAAIGLLVLSIFMIIFTKILVKPIVGLTLAANKFTTGEEHVDLEINTNDEVGVLANSFNIMIEKISKQKLALNELNHNLEGQVEERTADLKVLNKKLEKSIRQFERSQASLLQSEKLASIGELSAGVGHEINNPLAIANGNMQILEKSLSLENLMNQKRELVLRRINESHLRIKNIVNGLRVYARRSGDEIEVIDCQEIISRNLEMIRGIYEKEGVTVILKTDDSPKLIKGNAGKFQQVIMNFLSNAKDAMEGTGRKEIIEIAFKSDEYNLNIYISDTGKGIPKENFNKIFDSFFTTKDVGKGTGLGMSISSSIIKDMDGSLELESEVGKGTMFTLIFQLASKEELESFKNKNISVMKNKKIDITDFTGKVLVVDDEEGIREILVDILEDFGLKVDQVENGSLALSKIKENEYDIIFSDMQMPIMNGEVLVKKIRALDQFNGKIVIITGGLDTATNSILLERQIDSLLAKPFNTNEIQEVLVELLADRKKTKVA